jgi:hypothetical protein
MPRVIPAAAKFALWLLLVLSVAACTGRLQREGSLSEPELSAAQFARVEAAIRVLPPPLYQALSERQLYRLQASWQSLAPDGYPAIGLTPELLDNPAGVAEPLQRAILLQFFQGRVDQLNLFCPGAQSCPALAERKLQLAQFFNTPGLLPGTPAQQLSDAELLREAYGVHASEYFLDPRYRCKRPLVASVLESAWGYRRAGQDCAEPVPFLVAEGESDSQVRWIDPARVYAVHLLFAGSTGNSMSRFGHVTLRIVMCAKERRIVDQHCEEDLFDHLSLGFKANIDELDLSVWKGVKGGYAMKLYAKSFIDTYREYSIDEFRDLYSLPLVLNEQDKRLLVAALAEIHWSYSTDYRFFTQNCATEVQWLLNSLAFARQPSAPEFFRDKRYRPDSLFAEAKSSAGFKGEALANLSTAEQQGYYFPSTEGYYQLAVDSIADTLADSASARSPQDWLAQSAQGRAEYWLKPALERSQRKAYTGHAALVLEGWVARKLRRKLLTGLTYYYASVFQAVIKDDQWLTGNEKQLLSDCIDSIKTADRAGTSAEGIPQAPSAGASSVCNVKDEQLLTLMKRLFETFPVDTEQRNSINELTDTLKNIRTVNAAMGS